MGMQGVPGGSSDTVDSALAAQQAAEIQSAEPATAPETAELAEAPLAQPTEAEGQSAWQSFAFDPVATMLEGMLGTELPADAVIDKGAVVSDDGQTAVGYTSVASGGGTIDKARAQTTKEGLLGSTTRSAERERELTAGGEIKEKLTFEEKRETGSFSRTDKAEYTHDTNKRGTVTDGTKVSTQHTAGETSLTTSDEVTRQTQGQDVYTSAKTKTEYKSGALTDTSTTEVSTGKKTDYSKWDKPKDEWGKSFKRTRETKTTDQTEIKHTRERSVQIKEPASKELKAELKARAEKRKTLQNVGNVGAEVFGLKKEVKAKSEAKAEAALIKEDYVSADGKTEAHTFIGARATATAEGKASIGTDGIKAEGKLEAKAGLYDEVSGKTTGAAGTLEGSLVNKAEARAELSGSAKLDLNGLEVKAKAEVGVEVSSEVKAKYTTPGVNVGGVNVDASVDARGKASLEAKASVEGKVAITGDPPTLIAEGEAGASAVAKLEGDVTLRGGPFSVKASGYVSAGAEAKASGIIGYEDGKLKIGGSLGAALGVGGGGKVQVEIDLKQIKDIGVGLAKDGLMKAGADLDGDGKLTMKDAKVAADAVKKKVTETVDDVKEAVSETVDDVKEAVSDTVDSAKESLSDTYDSAKSTLKSGLSYFGLG